MALQYGIAGVCPKEAVLTAETPPHNTHGLQGSALCATATQSISGYCFYWQSPEQSPSVWWSDAAIYVTVTPNPSCLEPDINVPILLVECMFWSPVHAIYKKTHRYTLILDLYTNRQETIPSLPSLGVELKHSTVHAYFISTIIQFLLHE